jgi:quinol monooxygenase YgiN
MILIVGTIRLSPDAMDKAHDAIARVVMASQAEAGCHQYSYAADLFDPGLIHITERWIDEAALAAHQSAPHIAKWRGIGAALGVHDRNLSIYEVGEPRRL